MNSPFPTPVLRLCGWLGWRNHSDRLASGAATLLVTLAAAEAQAPSSVAGDGFLLGITRGSFPFANYGYFVFLPANSGGAYQVVGVYNVANSTGTYTYRTPNASTGVLSINDSAVGQGTVTATFSTASSGAFYATASAFPRGFQSGSLNFASVSAPASLTGKAFLATVNDGLFPFAECGSFVFRAASSGNSYVVTGDELCTVSSSGTYAYSVVNRSTGRLQLNDSFSGSSVVYVGFTDASDGGYAITQPSSRGFQVGSFTMLDTTRPTVAITSPSRAKSYTNAQTVSISAAASDNVAVQRVEFYENGSLRGTDTSAGYSYDWAFSAADNGAHLWTARAYDTAGNVAISSAVTLTVTIDTTPPLVVIRSPTNGSVFSAASRTITGTASDSGSPSSGLGRVELRLNGGSWTNATGTTSWSRSVTLDPCVNTIEVRSRDSAGNYSGIASVGVTYLPPNTVPSKPSNIAPAAGASGVSVAPTLEASTFTDPDPVCLGDAHAASEWQVLNGPGSIVVADSGTDSVNTVRWAVPAGRLYYGSNYQWQVRYRDSRGGWSSYSTRTAFATGGPLLSVSAQGGSPLLSWPRNSVGFTLQSSTNLAGTTWTSVSPLPVIVNGEFAVTNTTTNLMRFYRLKK